jgi:hypothetical protein
MILFKCTCGVPGMVPDGSGGRECSCGGCGALLTVPNESDPDCVLVYRSGLPEEGQVLSVEQLQGMVDAGELRANDLIWYQNIWMPMGEVFEMPVIEETLTLSGEDLAMRLTELPPMPVEGMAALPPPAVPRKSKKPPRRRPRKKASSGLFRQFSRSGERKRPLLLQVAYYSVVAVILLLGYNMGLGKLINYARHRPAYVLVYNDGSQDYELRLMGQTKWVNAGGSVVFQDLYVPGTRHRRLTVSHPDSKELCKCMKVPVKPGMDLVVNLDSQREFAVYDQVALKKQRLPDKDLDILVQELSSAKDPCSVFVLAGKLRGQAAPLLVERNRNKIITSHQYDLSMMPISRSPDYMARETARAQKAAAAAEKAKKAKEGKEGKEEGQAESATKKEKSEASAPKRVLLSSVQQELKFQNATLLYDPDEPRNDFSLRLDFKKGFRPLDVAAHRETKDKNSIAAIKGRSWAKGTFEKNRLTVSFSLPGTVQEGKTAFKGNWSYHATMALAGKDKDLWRWRWRFTGSAAPEAGKKNARSMELSIDQVGKVNKNIK